LNLVYNDGYIAQLVFGRECPVVAGYPVFGCLRVTFRELLGVMEDIDFRFRLGSAFAFNVGGSRVEYSKNLRSFSTPGFLAVPTDKISSSRSENSTNIEHASSSDFSDTWTVQWRACVAGCMVA
jgi:hypothetical protein